MKVYYFEVPKSLWVVNLHQILPLAFSIIFSDTKIRNEIAFGGLDSLGSPHQLVQLLLTSEQFSLFLYLLLPHSIEWLHVRITGKRLVWSMQDRFSASLISLTTKCTNSSAGFWHPNQNMACAKHKILRNLIKWRYICGKDLVRTVCFVTKGAVCIQAVCTKSRSYVYIHICIMYGCRNVSILFRQIPIWNAVSVTLQA